ncbi:heme exporter protein CcmD [Brevundimonas sp.]|uniref:heme exporter protein CcmD n=1 Tax=Brevundimonas sp. TaxID=1871086 RepID=UPI00262C8941|nr:heme exporter protein CcmD [Brevundimonas sp.]
MPDLDMSPYAAFVWPAWGISVLVLGAVVARAVVASRRWKAELKRLEDNGEAGPQVTQGAAGQAQ